MKRFLIALSLCLAFCCTGFGQTAADVPASKEDVDRYMQAIHSHEMMKQVVEAMTKPMPQMVHDQFMKSKEKLPADFEAQMKVDGRYVTGHVLGRNAGCHGAGVSEASVQGRHRCHGCVLFRSDRAKCCGKCRQ